MGYIAKVKDLDSELSRRLAELRARGLYREVRQIDSPQGTRIQFQGRSLLNFSSNDYLGLANHAELKQVAIDAVERYGTGAGASRLICGSLAPHHELEAVLASFKNTQAALAFSSGYATALGTICALMGSNDVIILDKLVHASIVDAVRLSGSKLRVFRHNDLNHLEELLQWANKRPLSVKENPAAASGQRILIVTESIFSMDGDAAPLREIVDLKRKYGACLMVDEAHATGLYGAKRRGLAEQLGVAQEIEIQMGTLGKALGSAGGYICGSRTLVDYLINRARSFIFSTAPQPSVAAAAAAAVRLVQSEFGEQLQETLWQNVATLRSYLANLGSSVPSSIVPLHIGEESKAVAAATSLLERGIFIPAIRYPTVARSHARLRLTLTAAHTLADLEQLRAALLKMELIPDVSPAEP